jgi:hypothetical protein
LERGERTERVRREGSREIKKKVAWSRQRKSEKKTEKEKRTGERSDRGRKNGIERGREKSGSGVILVVWFFVRSAASALVSDPLGHSRYSTKVTVFTKLN